jgi:hypothetical protein
MTFRLAVAAILAAALVVGYVVVAIVEDVPEDGSIGRPSWPGQGFVVLAAVGIIGVTSLIDVLRPGRARRSALRRPEAEQAAPHGSDEQRS